MLMGCLRPPSLHLRHPHTGTPPIIFLHRSPHLSRSTVPASAAQGESSVPWLRHRQRDQHTHRRRDQQSRSTPSSTDDLAKLIGCEVKLIVGKRKARRKEQSENATVGVIEEIVGDTSSTPHQPLLRVVGTLPAFPSSSFDALKPGTISSNAPPASPSLTSSPLHTTTTTTTTTTTAGQPFEDRIPDTQPCQHQPQPQVEVEFLVPLVGSIVPHIDLRNKVVHIDPPRGLLDLGKRRALARHLATELVPYERPPTSGVGASMMPTRKQLEAAGRHDLVRCIISAGGFLEVAEELGYRAVRRPAGYWEDESALDRELSLFVAANWVRLKLEENVVAFDPESGTQGSDGVEQLATAAMHGPETEVDQGRGGGGGGSNLGEETGASSYWYNQVTRRVSWTEPMFPETVPLDDSGSVIVAEDPADRAMPSRSAVQAAGRYDLHAAIMAAGGYGQVAKDLDRMPAWPPTRHLRSLRTLASELREFVEEQKLPRKMLPSAFQLQTLGRSDLHQAILRHGGYADVAHKMRWRPHRRRRGAWSDIGSVVKDVLRFAAEAATQRGESEESARMPTHEELRSAGRHDLRHALQRHGSTKVAELAGLPMSRRGGAKGAQVFVQSLLAEDGERSGGGEVATGDHVGHGK